jgi:hypothetical protein
MPSSYIQRYNRWQTIVPSDTVNISVALGIGENDIPTDAIWCGTAGTVTAVMQSGQAVQFTVVAGTLLPIAAIRVNLTGTAATLMVALFQV